MLDELFGSKVRAAILKQMFADAETDYYSRLLEKATKMDHKAIWKELNHLERNGIISSRRDGRLKRYKLNKFPGHQELRDFVLISMGENPPRAKKRRQPQRPAGSKAGNEQLTLI